MRFGALLLLVGLGPGVSLGQAPGEMESTFVRACELPVDASDAKHDHAVAPGARATRFGAACAPSSRTATFNVTFEGFSVGAEAAFRAALDTWSCQVDSDIPIRVVAKWIPLNPTTLGNAGPFLFRNFPAAPFSNTWYPAALADRYADRDLNAGQPDIQAEFNSSFGAWHIDHTTPPPSDRYDLYTVVLHEIGHGLGFIGGMRVEGGRGFVGDEDGADGPYAYDQQTRDRGGVSLLDASVYPDNSIALANVLRSEVYFDGPAIARVRDTPAPLFTPAVWTAGGSYSHLDEAAFPPGTPDGLMTPFVTRGESYDAPGGVTCAVLFDVGWTLAGGCADRVGDVTRATSAVAIALSGQNPTRTTTRVRVQAAPRQRVRVTLTDILGREVLLIHDRMLEGDLQLDVDARTLAPGLYRVVVTGESAIKAVSIVVVR